MEGRVSGKDLLAKAALCLCPPGPSQPHKNGPRPGALPHQETEPSQLCCACWLVRQRLSLFRRRCRLFCSVKARASCGTWPSPLLRLSPAGGGGGRGLSAATWGCVQAGQRSGGACWPQGTTPTAEADPAGSSLHRQYQDARPGVSGRGLACCPTGSLFPAQNPGSPAWNPKQTSIPYRTAAPLLQQLGKASPGSGALTSGTTVHISSCAVLLARCPLRRRPCHRRFSALSLPQARPPFPATQSRCLCGACFLPVPLIPVASASRPGAADILSSAGVGRRTGLDPVSRPRSQEGRFSRLSSQCGTNHRALEAAHREMKGSSVPSPLRAPPPTRRGAHAHQGLVPPRGGLAPRTWRPMWVIPENKPAPHPRVSPALGQWYHPFTYCQITPAGGVVRVFAPMLLREHSLPFCDAVVGIWQHSSLPHQARRHVSASAFYLRVYEN